MMGYIRYLCAETSGYVTYHLKKKLEEKGQDLPYEDIVEHTVEELQQGTLNKQTAQKRRENTGFLYDGERRELSKEETKNYEKALLTKEEGKDIKGLVASPGQVQGRVKHVYTAKDIKNFKKGEVLVSYETTPNIVLAMKRASAIITDFGGMTSHAAIVSRELGIPCIVGTSNATKKLKDGDLVEVDADKGVVRKV